MSAGHSTTAQGNEFRDSVKRLIELTPGCTNVQTEFQVGTQPVDIYYEERTSFRKLRVACECKDYGHPLTKDLIAKNIYPRYQPLLVNNFVDAVRIIAPLDLGAVAEAYVRECGFSFHTVDQLESEIMDFRPYMRALRTAFADDGLDQYYVSPTLDGDDGLEEAIDSWIAGPSSQPIAILAGYGMGKTSFARRLAYVLAERALKDPRARIPILIPLSEISSEQTLSGLLGKLFTAQHSIPSYHYNTFNELNRRGRFVTILDGFDEMKHTISWADFKLNFIELNRLHGTNARVLLLGRPSALLSEDQELFVLRGKRRAGNQIFTVTGAPEYVQIRLREFSSTQAIDFIRRYATYRSSAHSAIRSEPLEKVDIEARIESIRTDPEMMGLVTRPVQAKMLADLSIDPEVQWRSFSRYALYREFIGRITEREALKPTRSTFHQEDRLSFARRVAWWTWRRASSSGFNIAELPDLLLGSAPSETGATTEGVKRDLVSGSILEKKAGDSFYFPHRSFLEFLVAEYIGIEAGPTELEEVSSALTREIVDFIRESDNAAHIAEWANDLENIDVAVSGDFLALIAWAQNRVDLDLQDHADPDATPRDLMISYYRLVDRGSPSNETANYVRHAFVTCTSEQTRIACILSLLLIQQTAAPQLRSALRSQIVAFVLTECLDEMKRLLDQTGRNPLAVDKRSPFMRLMLAAFRPTYDRGELSISTDIPALVEQINSALSSKWRLEGEPLSIESGFEEISFSTLSTLEKRLALSQDGARVTTFFRRFPEPSKLIPVTHKSQQRIR